MNGTVNECAFRKVRALPHGVASNPKGAQSSGRLFEEESRRLEQLEFDGQILLRILAEVVH